MKKDKELGASTDAGEVGTLAVSLTGLATRRVARTTVSPSAAPGLTDGSNMAKAVVTRDVAGCRETAVLVRYSFLVRQPVRKFPYWLPAMSACQPQ
jgi:hypothetical protein